MLWKVPLQACVLMMSLLQAAVEREEPPDRQGHRMWCYRSIRRILEQPEHNLAIRGSMGFDQ